MRRNARSITTSPEIVRHIEGLTEANFKLLTQLIAWLDGHEKQHTKYRVAMCTKLARLEATISLILVGQLGLQQGKAEWVQEDRLKADSEWAEAYIAEHRKEIGMKMIHYIYGKDPAPEEDRHDRRRRWWGWEI
jgi:hypothetical protein